MTLDERWYTSRMVTRFYDRGQPFIISLLKPGIFPLRDDVKLIIEALWDRQDTRSTAARLQAAGLRGGADQARFWVAQLAGAGMLCTPDFDEVGAWVHKLESELDELPRVDQVELTNACPFTCGFCPRGIGKMTRPIGHLDLGLLQGIVDQVKHLSPFKPFGLHHFGEPLLHPQATKAVEIIAKAGLEAEISFNPIMLKERTAAELLEAGIGVIIVSLDGLDNETLVQIRGRHAGPFGDASAKLEKLIALAAQRDKPPTVMVSMVGTVDNRHQWKEMFKRFSRPEMPWLKPVVRLLNDFGDPDIKPLGIARLRQLCGSPYKYVSVTWNGTVVPCCHDFNAATPLGDLTKQSLKEVWTGDTMRAFRQRWIAKKFGPDEPCGRCSWRPDNYVAADSMADTDAWTGDLWGGTELGGVTPVRLEQGATAP